MKRIIAFTFILFAISFHSQETANRFFYEETFKPKKDSAKMDKVMAVLDIVKDKSIFRDYTGIEQDSALKAKVEMMRKTGTFSDPRKGMKKSKFSYKIVKKYPDMQVQYSETLMNGMSPIQLAYMETPKFDWKIENEKAKIGEYNAQKATTDFGGRKWTAWFSTDLPFQDGPYKFYGLPGLIVKVEDTDKNYSWELKGNKQVPNFEEETQMEKMSPGGAGKVTVVTREKFDKTFEEYKKDPFASFRSQIPAEMMSRKLPGSDKTLGEMLKDGEKEAREFYSANNNPIEIPQPTEKKK